MQVQHLRTGLVASAELLEAGRQSAAADALRALSAAFDPLTTSMVNATVAKIKRTWARRERAPGYPGRLKDVLSQLETTSRALGAVKFADDLKTLLDLFQGDPGLTTDAFVEDVKTALAPPPPKPPKQPKAPRAPKRKAPPPDPIVVAREYGERLDAARYKNDEFDALLADLRAKADKKGKAGLSLDQLKIIARVFLGYQGQYKKKGELTEAIRRRQLQDAIQASKERAIDKLGV